MKNGGSCRHVQHSIETDTYHADGLVISYHVNATLECHQAWDLLPSVP